MDTTDTTNLEAPEAEEVVTEPTESEEPEEADVNSEEPSDEDNPEGLTEAELLEIELDGKKFKLPKEVEPLLMFQKDYTQKRQRDAEAMREWEVKASQEREELQQERVIVSEVGRNIAKLDEMEERLEYLRTVDPDTLPPPLLMRYTAERASLENKFTLLNQETTERVEALRQQQAQVEARRINDYVKKVNTANPRIFWDGDFGQARNLAISKFAAEELNIPPDVQKTLPPEVVPALYHAMMNIQNLRKQTQALTTPKVEAKPVPEVSGKKSASSLTIKDADKLSADKWLEWRNKQVARKRG